MKRIEGEGFPPEVLADEEPRYLRRQKPVEVRKKSVMRRFREDVLPWLKLVSLAGAVLVVVFTSGRFLLYSPALQLTDPGQVEVAGNQYVSRDTLVALFSPDRNRSLLRVPLETRRAQIERIPWVETARVQRVFPDRIRVEITERRPVVFLRTGSELALMDAQGVILERPTQGDFRLPVVSGLGEAVPLAERAGRMRMFQQFVAEIEGVRAGSSDLLSEADLSSAEDLRAMLVPPAGSAGGPAEGAQAVLVHFGSSDFGPRFRLLLENFAQWQAQAGRVSSIDLRFKKQVVVNREP
ncbi:MAG TPA: FtsQ-type POTRA domain-containing protein [Candidatus Acidoferrales bacterium]|nr:FtsQ-type POTRA domain-containing protein [Candidatus Acidoferrales bacterium]